MQFNFRNGHDYERAIFGDPEEVISGSLRIPSGFREDVGRIIKSISRSKPHEKFPRTPMAKSLYFGVRKHLGTLGIGASGLRLFSLRGTDADRYYETDALFYLPPSCGYECVVTIDARLIGPTLLTQLRDYWIESSERLVYSETMFQGDLFAHNRILSEYLNSREEQESVESNGLRSPWILSPEYKKLWERGYLPAIPEEMIDRPTMRPENHLILPPYYLENSWRRKAFSRLVAIEFRKQISVQPDIST
jgi:hypothetical protein